MSRDQIEQIKERLDILEVARGYISPFKKSGNNYFARCPFHSEKTPSFSVNPELGIYKCFGCGQSGDVITLIQELEGVDFPKALEIAAKRAGVTLARNFSPQDERRYKERQQILTVNALVAEYYHYILTKHDRGAAGREYAKSRGIKKDLIDRFMIGYAPRSYTNLLQFLKKRGYSEQDLVRWGLVVSGSGRVYDKFRSRLIFPLVNQHDDIIGFSGRIIIKNTKAPKYLHSPQTEAFDKSAFLFGINHAKNEMRKQDFAVFCEGQLDVISSHKTNIKNVVASLGTSLAAKQLEVAKRYTDTVYFSFDTDMAGETALIRAVDLAHQQGMSVKVVTLPEGADADELIQKDSAKWEEAVKGAESVFDHMVQRLSNRLDMSSLTDKEEFASRILPVIARYPKRIEQSHYIKKIAVILNVHEELLQEELDRLSKANPTATKVDTKRIVQVLDSTANVKEEYVFALVLQHPHFLDESFEYVKSRYFNSPAAREVLKKLRSYHGDKKRFQVKNFISSLEEHEKTFVQNLLLKRIPTFDLSAELVGELKTVMRFLKNNYYQNKIKSVKVQIEDAENSGDKKKVNTLLEKLVSLNDKLNRSAADESDER